MKTAQETNSLNVGEEIRIPAKDDFLLSAKHYPPTGSEKSGKIIVISSASGVRKEIYNSFAKYLSSHGSRVFVFDYRGIGGSLVNDVKNSDACMTEWGSKDLSGVLAWVAKNYSDENIFLVAHSVGGQIIGLASNCVRIKGMVLVACSHGYWGNWGPIGRGIMIPALYFLFPLLTKVLKYFPSKKFGLGENLPAGVAREWANWARNPDYLFHSHPYAKDRLGELKVPVLVYSFKDDFFAPKNGVKRLLDIFPNASKQWNHIAPQDIRLKSIGHNGFFDEAVEKTLWNDTFNWLKGC